MDVRVGDMIVTCDIGNCMWKECFVRNGVTCDIGSCMWEECFVRNGAMCQMSWKSER